MWMGDVVRREGVPLIRDGRVPLTDAPGLGLELDQALVEKHLTPGSTAF